VVSLFDGKAVAGTPLNTTVSTCANRESPPPGFEVASIEVRTDESTGETSTKTRYGRIRKPNPATIVEIAAEALERVKITPALLKVPHKRKAETGRDLLGRYKCSDLLAVFPVFDNHTGVGAWHGKFTLSDGMARATSTTAALAAQSLAARQAAIIFGGDHFHINGPGPRFETPASQHALSVSSQSYKEILDCGIETAGRQIEILRSYYETVLVRVLPGNHDPSPSISLSRVLAERYAKTKGRTGGVAVIDEPENPYWWHRHGSCYLGAAHGLLRVPAIVAMMSTENPEWWGVCPHRHFFFGHFHSQKQWSLQGCDLVCCSHLPPRDAWAFGKGFVWQQPKMISYTFDASAGLVQTNVALWPGEHPPEETAAQVADVFGKKKKA
jgi:hypothetical protein